MYNDRGIIKWLPFDALAGFRESINNLLIKRGEKVKPVLAIDQIEKINYLLTESYNLKKEINITYYQNGYFKSIYGIIEIVNELNNYLTISNIKVELESIIDLEIN